MSHSVSGINPLFQGDIGRAASPPLRDAPSHQSFNPIFKAQHEQLDISSSSWQLQGLVANARTTAQEMSALAWNHSTSDSSVVVLAHTAQTHTKSSSDDDDDTALSMAQLLADDRQDSAEWVSSSSSSEGVVAPLRLLSFPNLALMEGSGRAGVAQPRPLGRDDSVPVSVQSGWHAALWSSDQQQAPGPTLRERFAKQQGSQQPAPAQDTLEQPDIWAALERQPSPVITLRQRFALAQQEQQQQQQQLEAQEQGSSMQPSQVVLELSPEDIMLQEPGLDVQSTSSQELEPNVPGQEPAMVHQQSGLVPEVDGVSARSVARQQSSKLAAAQVLETPPAASNRAQRRLAKLPTALFSEPGLETDEAGNRGVHFGSAAASEEQDSRQHVPLPLARAKSSLKKPQSPQGLASLRRRSFRRQASSVSFATVSAESDDGSDDGSVSGKSKPLVSLQGAAGIAAPLAKTVSSVWAMIRGGGASAPPQPAAYQPTRTDSRDYDNMPAARPLRPTLKADQSRWQMASKKAVAARSGASSPKRPMSRFGSFFDVVTQATAARQPSLSRKLGQEHVEMGVRMLLDAKEKGSAPDTVRSGKLQQDPGLQTQQSLAKIMQVLTAKQISKSVSMASTVQVRIDMPATASLFHIGKLCINRIGMACQPFCSYLIIC